jgi:hypothetical protein
MDRSKSISRRGFLKRTAGVAVGGLVFPYVVRSSALGNSGAVVASNRIVMGGIGVGSMGTGDMHGFLGKREVQIVAVCDVDKRHRDNAKRIVDERYGNNDCGSYNDYRELIGRGDLDAVFTALPDQWHAVVAVAAAGRFAKRSSVMVLSGRRAASSGLEATFTGHVSWS